MKKNTAVLVVHGIGNQRPIETLDLFCRGLIDTLVSSGSGPAKVSHEIVAKPTGKSNEVWFDNFIRIRFSDAEATLDIYEYYWANKTEDKISLDELQSWVDSVASGANAFYKENAQFGVNVNDVSIFFKEKDGSKTFKGIYFRGFLVFMRLLIPLLDFLAFILIKPLSLLPLVGKMFNDWAKSWKNTMFHSLTNVLGDIAIYNTPDEKSKHYEIRRDILSGSVNALSFLLEPNEQNQLKYEKVILVGHSLGSQVSFDAINRLNHLINSGLLKGYDAKGRSTLLNRNHLVSDIFTGYVTLGSPLDKTAFFFREQVKQDAWVRKQVLSHFHCFRQKNWNIGSPVEGQLEIENTAIVPLFDSIKWLNFYDRHDYVSGSLDYYSDVENIDCSFNGGTFSFTHSWYWKDTKVMYRAIIDKLFE